MEVTVGRLNDETNRIKAHLPDGGTEVLDIPRDCKVNCHDIVDFTLKVMK
jgi:hypothetical protein